MPMFRNYFLITFRLLIRQWGYTSLNIMGLSVGMAVGLLIMLFVFHELSYDRFHAQANRIFKASNQMRFGEQNFNSDYFSAATAPRLQQRTPEIESFVRIAPYNHVLLWPTNQPDRKQYEDKLLFADSTLLSVFSFSLVSGNARTALRKPFSLLITPAMATKYFGKENPIGKKLSYQGNSDFFTLDANTPKPTEHVFEVTGILEQPPSNSSVSYQFVASFATLATLDKKGFEWTEVSAGGYQTYFLLKNEQKASQIARLLAKMIVPPLPEAKVSVRMEALPDLHLRGYASEGNATYVYLFLGIALTILLLALINYMSLTTARATQRAKEVGVRKAMGANRLHLGIQFFGESVFICVLSFLLSFLWMQLALPTFQKTVQIELSVQLLWHPVFLGIALATFVISTLLAGSYPALVLSAFSPLSALKGGMQTPWGSVTIRRAFIVFQFAVSGALICCSLVIRQQMDFIRTKDIGLTKDQMLVIPLEGSMGKNYLSLKEEIRNTTGVVNAGTSTSVPFVTQGTNTMITELADKRTVSLYYNSVDKDFLKTYGIQWQQKTPAAEAFTGISKTAVINQRAAKELGFKSILGNYIPVGSRPKDKVEIIGIVKDYHFQSLQSTIQSVMLLPIDDTTGALIQKGGYLSVHLDKKVHLPDKIAQLRQLYEQYSPEKPFEYFFLDEKFNQLYQYQDRLAALFGGFTGFAIFIACLGLFGLATYTAERRTKEIGIRKILGASVRQIFILLSQDFVKLVAIAFVIAVPVAWYAMHQWLQGFAYKIDISWWIFVLAGILAVAIALVTVSFQAIRAATANPVKSLRSE